MCYRTEDTLVQLSLPTGVFAFPFCQVGFSPLAVCTSDASRAISCQAHFPAHFCKFADCLSSLLVRRSLLVTSESFHRVSPLNLVGVSIPPCTLCRFLRRLLKDSSSLRGGDLFSSARKSVDSVSSHGLLVHGISRDLRRCHFTVTSGKRQRLRCRFPRAAVRERLAKSWPRGRFQLVRNWVRGCSL